METFDFVAILKRLCVYDYVITEGSFTQLPGSLYLYSLRHLSSSSIWETSQSKATLVFSKLIVLCRISLSASSPSLPLSGEVSLVQHDCAREGRREGCRYGH